MELKRTASPIRELKRTASPARLSSFTTADGGGGGSSSGSSGGERVVPTIQLLLLNAAVFAVELSATAVFTYIPPMLLKAGFDEKQMSWVIGTGPFVCLLAVPAIGAASDRCTGGGGGCCWRLGKRLPFILVLCSGALLSLVAIPYLDGVANAAAAAESTSASEADHASAYARQRMAAGALAVFVVLLDFCNQACLTPCEAFLSDVTRGTSVRDRAFSFYSLLSSLGGCVGYAITAVSWEATPIGALFGDQDHCVFSLIVIIFLAAMLATLRTAFGLVRSRDPGGGTSSSALTLSSPPPSPYPINGQLAGLIEMGAMGSLKNGIGGGMPPPPPPAESAAAVAASAAPRLCALVARLCRWALLRPLRTLADIANELLRVPLVLRRLVCANFCAWAAIMTFLLFYTDFVGEVAYGGSPREPVGSDGRQRFDEGVRVGSAGLFLHAATSALAAAAIERLQGRVGLRSVYLGGLLVFSATVAVMVFVRSPALLNVLAGVTGIAFAAITTVPFSLVGIYHECKEVYFLDVPIAGRMSRGIGTDMATLDTAYFSSQVLLLSFMGYLVHICHSAVMYMVTATVMSALACFFISRLVYSKQQMLSLMEKTSVTK